jgi:hypothetical protein
MLSTSMSQRCPAIGVRSQSLENTPYFGAEQTKLPTPFAWLAEMYIFYTDEISTARVVVLETLDLVSSGH